MFLRSPATPGTEQTLAREAPARRVVRRRQFFRRQVIGLLCGKGVEPPRGCGRPSGARESQVFLGYIITKMFSKIPLDIITSTATEEHYIMRIPYCIGTSLYNKYIREKKEEKKIGVYHDVCLRRAKALEKLENYQSKEDDNLDFFVCLSKASRSSPCDCFRAKSFRLFFSQKTPLFSLNSHFPPRSKKNDDGKKKMELIRRSNCSNREHCLTLAPLVP